MSFNLGLRLNNLQYQVNQKAGNPLTSDLNCGGFDINDAGTINYTSLNPPVSASTQNINETLTIGNSAGNLSIVDLSSVVLSDVDGVNQDIIISQLPGLGGRINIYQENDIIDPFNSSALLAVGNLNVSNNITAGGNLNVGGLTFPSSFILDGSLVIVNDGPPLGQCILSCNTSNQLVISNGLTTPGNITCGTLNYSSLNPSIPTPNLSSVLSSGSDAGGASITNVNQLTVSQLNYSTLNPPVAGSAQNLQQVLTTGNNAGGLNMTNVGSVFVSSLQGIGTNGAFVIGNNPLNNYTNDDGTGNPELTLGFCNLNMGGSKIYNLDPPISGDEPATKTYADGILTTANNYVNGRLYGSGAEYYSVRIPNAPNAFLTPQNIANGATANIWTSSTFTNVNNTFNFVKFEAYQTGAGGAGAIVYGEMNINGSGWVPSNVGPFATGANSVGSCYVCFWSILDSANTYQLRVNLQNVSGGTLTINSGSNVIISTNRQIGNV